MDAIMLGHGCSLLRTGKTMDVIMVVPWVLSLQNRFIIPYFTMGSSHNGLHVITFGLDAHFLERMVGP